MDRRKNSLTKLNYIYNRQSLPTELFHQIVDQQNRSIQVLHQNVKWTEEKNKSLTKIIYI